jgi:uncharacterized protein YkwD
MFILLTIRIFCALLLAGTPNLQPIVNCATAPPVAAIPKVTAIPNAGVLAVARVAAIPRLVIASASMSTAILRFVNQHRRSMGLPGLQANSFISSVALGHSRDMLTGRSAFGHDGFKDRINEIKGRLGTLHVAAENVASGPMGAKEVVDGWLHSPGHRRNIEGDFRLTGIGVATASNGMVYFTQILIK